MGKKLHNAKARQNRKVDVNNSCVPDIDIELVGADLKSGYDEANALALPSKKRETKIKAESKTYKKLLTKKQRKHLQAIVDKKKKNAVRADLIKKLAETQISGNELQTYTSVQTIGVKKLQKINQTLQKKQDKQPTSANINNLISLKGSSKRKMLVEEVDGIESKRKNPNFVGLDSENSEDDGSESDECVVKEISILTANQIEMNKNSSITHKPSIKEINDKKDEITQPLSRKFVGDLSEAGKSKTKEQLHQTVHVPVYRDPEVESGRLKLPILSEEQYIMETINTNSIIIIAGETGSGKTTQIPQFLYESGYALNKKLIGITEPRRVAAIAMSKRIAHEMNLSEREISYLIRFQGNTTSETSIKFMTDGVLLKEIEKDFLLCKYSVIVIDEAHERSAYTDILVGLLSRIVPLRLKNDNPLKLIIMSATLRVEDFTSNSRLFKNPPPLINVEARQFPVTIHFQKTTPNDYVDAAFKKVINIHTKLPDGGILVFLTGQQEVNILVGKLRKTCPLKYVEEKTGKNKKKNLISNTIVLPKISLADYELFGDDNSDIENDNDNTTELNKLTIQSDSEAEHESDIEDDCIEDFYSDVEESNDFVEELPPLWVLPLYSMLPMEKQNRVFQTPPNGYRLCVVSTNIAETSLTIPDVKYVVDSGRQKTRLYDKITGVSSFVITFTSKASADQRAGRSGRISSGHCYRLYSSAVFNDQFEKFSTPDIEKKPIDDLFLQMRCLGIDRVNNFPFPSPPDMQQLQAAEQRLIILGALENNQSILNKKDLPPIVTDLGRVISRFPVAPRFGKMLALSHQKKLLPYTVCLVAALSVQEIFTEVNYEKESCNTSLMACKWQKKRLSWVANGNYELLGDPMVLLRALGGAEFAHFEGRLKQFCDDNGIRYKAIIEVRKLRKQLTQEINSNVEEANLCVDPKMTPPTDIQARLLRQVLLAGMCDRVARKISVANISDKSEKRRLKYGYNCIDMEEPVHIHSSSVLKHKQPEWVIYQEVYEIQNGDERKMFMRGITAIEPEWLLLYAPLLCNIREIRDDPQPKYNAKDGRIYCFVDATFGKSGWELPLSEIEMPFSEKACYYLGMYFLEGLVCPNLAVYKPKLKLTSTSLLKSWSNLNENIIRFKRALLSNQIHTKSKLLDKWLKNSDFLLEEYSNLLYDVSHSELSSMWPPSK